MFLLCGASRVVCSAEAIKLCLVLNNRVFWSSSLAFQVEFFFHLKFDTLTKVHSNLIKSWEKISDIPLSSVLIFILLLFFFGVNLLVSFHTILNYWVFISVWYRSFTEFPPSFSHNRALISSDGTTPDDVDGGRAQVCAH